MIPLYLGFNSAGQKTLFFMFLMFQDPNGLKRDSYSGDPIFYRREATWAKEACERRPQAPKTLVATPPGGRADPLPIASTVGSLRFFAHHLRMT